MKKDEVDTFIKSIDTVSHKIDLYVSDQLKDLGLTPSTYFVILKIGAYGELTQEQLFQMLSINPSNVTRRLNRLIEVGYVSKKQSTDDKRRRLVKLTEVGQQKFDELYKRMPKLNDTVTQVFDEDEKEILAKLMTKMEANMDELLK